MEEDKVHQGPPKLGIERFAEDGEGIKVKDPKTGKMIPLRDYKP